MDERKVLVVSGHPNIDGDSVANKAILEAIASWHGAVAIDRLDALYPDYRFDVETEQAKLKDADVVVLQFPLYWYSVPALMQKWFEDVLTHGFSHGSTGTALKGKPVVFSATVGAPGEAYAKAPVEDLLAPLKALAAMTGMRHAGTVVTYGVSYLGRNDEGGREEILSKAREHAARLRECIEGLAAPAEEA